MNISLQMLTYRIRKAPYDVYGKTEKHHMVFFYICTRNNKLTIQGLLEQGKLDILLRIVAVPLYYNAAFFFQAVAGEVF